MKYHIDNKIKMLTNRNRNSLELNHSYSLLFNLVQLLREMFAGLT